jgi:hypothetical protein
MFGAEPIEPIEVEVALERRAAARIAALGDDEVDGFAAELLDVRARGIEMVVRRDLHPGLQQHGEQQALGGAALMGRDDVRKAGDVHHDALEAREAA